MRVIRNHPLPLCLLIACFPTEAGLGLTQVSFNAVLWAFAYNGRLVVMQAMAMYCIACGHLAGGSHRSPTEAEEENKEEREEEMELEELEHALSTLHHWQLVKCR